MNLFYAALLAHYKSEEATALAELNIAVGTAVGVAGHSGHIENLKKWVEVLANARGNMRIVEEIFQRDTPQDSPQDENQ